MSYKLTQTGQEVQALLNQIKNGGQSQVTDAVLYTPQNLEEKEQEQARKNIGAAAENQIPTGAVLYSQQQNLTGDQQAQARANIDAAGTEQVPTKVSELENDAHYITENQIPNVPVTSVNGQTGAVTIAVPTKTSQLTNDSNFATTEDIPTSLPVTYKRVSGELPTTGWSPLGWEQSTLPAARRWSCIAYGKGKFVTIATNGSDKGAYSADGINWTEMTMSSSELWSRIAYGNGKFVAVATSTDKGAYSVDGINWTKTTMPSSPSYMAWAGVTYGNGKFVAFVTDSSYCAYSNDGITWTAATLSVRRNWRDMVYGNDKFVAIAKGTDKGAYSTDGITWTEMTLPASRNWQCITYGEDKFIAIAANSDKGAYSTDGINWTEMTLPASRDWSCTAYGNGKFVVIEYNGLQAAYSTDGITWLSMTTPIIRSWSGVVYGDNKFVVVSKGASVSSQNNKGLYWEVNSNKSTYTISDTFITTNTSVKMYLTDESMVKTLRMSNGSITVLRDSVPTTAIPYKYEVKQTSTPGGFDVINSYVPTVPTKTSELTNDSGFVTQADIPATPTSLPVTYKKVSGSLPTSGWNTLWWKQNTMPTSASWSSVVYGDGKFVAVAEHGDKGAYSTDGINWIETTLPARKQWQSIAYGNGKFVAVAYSSAYGAYSIDGINWTNMMMSDLGNWIVTYGGSKFVAVSDSSVSAYSTDGINWIKTTLPASRSWQSIAYGNGKFVAVAWSSDKGAYSTDGINWIEMSMPASRMWRSVASEDGKFVAVAQNSDKGAYSTDGITWAEMSMPASRGWRSVASGDGKFVAVAYDSSVSAYSMDGINWIETTLPANQKWHSVTYGNGKYVAVAYPNTYGAYWNVFAQPTYTIAITDTDITTNTSVKMYLTDEGGAKAQSKANGSITVIRDTVPTTAIPYKYEVEQTSEEGLFEVINGYVPTKTSELTNSYKAIKSILTPSDWQEVPTRTQPFFVGENAMEWAETNGVKSKSQSTNIGLVEENDYTITIVVDGQTYTETAMASGHGGMVALEFTITNDIIMAIYDGVDVSTMEPGTGSICMVGGLATTTTSFIITKFEGGDFGTIIQATIVDSAIKVNSAVTMYINTSYKISEGEKTDGSVILTTPSIPTTDIHYTLEIVGTDTEGLFKLVLSDYNDLSNIPVINQDLSESEFTAVKDMYYRHIGVTNSDYTNGVIYKCVENIGGSLGMSEIATKRDAREFTQWLPRERTVSKGNSSVSITGGTSPYLFTVQDFLVDSGSFVRVYPMNEDTETWLNEHTLSSIITEESGKFTFKVDTTTLPNAFSIRYFVQDFAE